MANKKSRKGGPIGIPKSSIPAVRQPSDRVRKKKGNKAGSRQQLEQENQQQSPRNKKDSRIGSKVPVDLLRHKRKQEPNLTIQTQKFATPRDELNAIEQDSKLQSLLDKQDTKTLTAAEKVYVEEKLARHLILCDLLGISSAVDDIEQDEYDPLSGLDAISMDDFKD